ncbi:DUF481 domain-containing protein [Blochmannia endosymbiont of Polyrhachis (Hedomyrma) turneri]|uniref:DUF481 domain-containing protein n=1 Tax=Blochmannia endosymbiont of Polyrhachis (Hedomyrma) turneri TaxID=1505596 RepID=UPI001185B2E9|nr:DUF481 domain-containing protein [Blochmannia endosymbiont of Polyrhachis (Hedomyrma) turneri]
MFSVTPRFCFAKKLLCIDSNIQKKYNFLLLKSQNYNFSVEIPTKKIFDNNHYGLKYQACIQSQYYLNNDKFLFVKYSGIKEYYNGSLFKNILLIGSGYNIFHGPVCFSQMRYSPGFYYTIVYNNHQNNCFKSLMYGSGMYTYQLINNIYYYQYLGVLANLKHICTKFENSLSIFFNSQTVLLKCSYNVVLNENKFQNLLPNVNKYVSVSFTYFL